MTTLIITNDFPPRIGGIESFVGDIAELLDRDVLVYASGPPGAARTDADRGYPVIRAGELLLPTPRVAARAADDASDQDQQEGERKAGQADADALCSRAGEMGHVRRSYGRLRYNATPPLTVNCRIAKRDT